MYLSTVWWYLRRVTSHLAVASAVWSPVLCWRRRGDGSTASLVSFFTSVYFSSPLFFPAAAASDGSNGYRWGSLANHSTDRGQSQMIDESAWPSITGFFFVFFLAREVQWGKPLLCIWKYFYFICICFLFNYHNFLSCWTVDDVSIHSVGLDNCAPDSHLCWVKTFPPYLRGFRKFSCFHHQFLVTCLGSGQFTGDRNADIDEGVRVFALSILLDNRKPGGGAQVKTI